MRDLKQTRFSALAQEAFDGDNGWLERLEGLLEEIYQLRFFTDSWSAYSALLTALIQKQSVLLWSPRLSMPIVPSGSRERAGRRQVQ